MSGSAGSSHTPRKRQRVEVTATAAPALVPLVLDTASEPPPCSSSCGDSTVAAPLPSPTPSSASTSSTSSEKSARQVIQESHEKLGTGEWIAVPKVVGPGRKRSDIWDTFHVVVDKATKLEVRTAQCIACKAVLAFASGPSSLKKHKDSHCPGLLLPRDEAGRFVPVPAPLRDAFLDKLADTCAATMGSVNLLTSDAVMELMQVVVDVAARCKGRIDMKALMPASTTIMNRIEARANDSRAKLVPRVREAIRDGRCQGSTDMWTDDQLKQHFIAITASFVDEKGDVSETHDLVTAKFPTRMKATGYNIRAAMQQAMADIGIPPDEFDLIEWVTDKGANIRKALEDLSREDCAAHLINTVVRRTLSIPFYELRQKAILSCGPATANLLETYEEAVRAARSATPSLVVAGVNLKVIKNKLQVPQAQFHSNYAKMLQSAMVNKPQVLAVLEALGRQGLANRLRQLDSKLASDVIDFLSPLERKKDVASTDLASVMSHLDVKPEDCEEIASMKRALSDLRLLMDVLFVIKEAKELVTYLKASGLSSGLTKKVLQEVETRWNSIHTMLSSVLESFDEISFILEENGEGRRIAKLDREMLEWLTNFLKEFKEDTTNLEGDSTAYPTLPYVLLVSTSLRDHCQVAESDNMHLCVIKSRCHQFLIDKFQPSLKAKVATFLWPDFKELTMLSPAEVEQVHAKVRGVIQVGEDEGTDFEAPPSPPPKVPRIEDKFRKYRDQQAFPIQVEDEVTRYLRSSVSVPANQLLQHWKMMDRPNGLPKLAKLARQELGKLATAAPSERVWSKAAFIFNKKRNRLSAKHLDSIIFLSSYLRNFKKNGLK